MMREILFLILAASVTAEPARPDSPGASPEMTALIEAHNRERAAAKLPPLRTNSRLEAAALVQARDMADHNKLSHTGTDGSTPAQRIERQCYRFLNIGENVAKGAGAVEDVMRMWMNSPHHKENILGKFDEIGVARVNAVDGASYWCTDFGRPLIALDPEQAMSALVEVLNRERKKLGQPALTVHPTLAAAARRHAHDMAARDKLSAKDDDGLTAPQRVEKEGYGFLKLSEASTAGQPTAEDVIRAWAENTSSRQNIVGDFSEVGVGYATGAKGTPYWSVLLAKPAR